MPAVPPTVLVVDDDAGVRMLVRDTLELDGFDVREAADGPTALEVMVEEPPDCVILDIMMPGMSGLEVLEQVRKHEALHDLPVILLTAAGDDSTTWEGWRAGADCFMSKPFDPDALLHWVHMVDERRRTQLPGAGDAAALAAYEELAQLGL